MLAASFALTATTAFGPAFADDTEVFFGQVDPTMEIYPNVLFVLDTSGSMNWGDSGYTGTRLERMKDALTRILDNAANVNVGVMRFNGSSGGGAVLFPVTPIEEQICEDGACGEQSLIFRVNNEAHDIEEFVDNNDVLIDGNILSMGTEGAGREQLVGLRFATLDIPQGAQITSANLEFTADSTKSGSTELTIRAEAIDDSPAFEDADSSVSSRTLGSSTTTWTPSTWIANQVYQSDDISNVIQEVIDRGDWCGGNSLSLVIEGTGRRDAKSYHRSPTEAPALKVTYDDSNIPDGEGCQRKVLVAAIGASEDDARQQLSDNKVNTRKSDLRMGKDGWRDQLIATRFRDLDLPQGADIESAVIEFEVDRYRSGTLHLKVEGEAIDDSPTLREVRHNLSGRSRTTSVAWNNVPALGWNSKMYTPELEPIVQEIVDRSGWSTGNAMTFLFSKTGGGGKRELESYNGEPSAAPKLRIVYRAMTGGSGGEPTYITARDKLKQVVNGLTATGGTPIVDAYYEASRYYLGETIDYGTKRGYSTNRYHRVSHPDSYTGGTVNRDYRCTDADLDNWYCRSERITGSPTYISPLDSSCQTNHIVFLSDGAATSNSAKTKVKNLIGESSCEGSGSQECGTELAKWLQETDHNPGVNGKQNISTYTIGFNFSGDFLPSIAAAGGGSYYDASSADELVNVFQSILGDVLSVDTSFVAPGATVNQFNRLTHRNDIYFALFKPDTRPTWAGNLKRYKVGEANGDIQILDLNDQPAVDQSSGFFSADARSWWSSDIDGNSVARGGAAEQQSLHNHEGVGERQVYTVTSTSVPTGGIDLTSTENSLHEDNNAIDLAMLGLGALSGTPAENAAYRESLLQWARGVDVLDDDEDDDHTDTRNHMGDPMHSRPVLLNYANAAHPDGADTTVFVSTNEGYLHAMERDHGRELYSIVPQELLPNLNSFYTNESSLRHPYGLDGSMSVWTEDTNGNVMIDPGEKAYVFVGMRRGGNNIYAFDVSDRLSPRLAWVIKGGAGGTPGFEEMGQSWSKAIPARINFQNTPRDVLIFAAGYDVNQDSDPHLSTARTVDSVGRGIYMVDMLTGQRLWAIGGLSSDGSPDQRFPGLDYSMPSDIRVIDIDADGFSDQLYVADMGGQVWRFDANRNHVIGDPLFQGGILANLSDSGLANERRFYYEPDVALIAKEGQRFLSISIGSGWRAHPLDDVTHDRFYMLRSNAIEHAPAGYGRPIVEGSSTYVPVTEADLTDVTNVIDPDTNQYGWFMDLPSTGEKVLGDSTTVNGQIIFTTFRPDVSVGACSTAIGSGAVYVVNVLDGSPTIDIDNDGDENELSDRSRLLAHGGIPPEPSVLITEQGLAAFAGPEIIDLPPTELTKRTSWTNPSEVVTLTAPDALSNNVNEDPTGGN